nr:putative ribonuclease H-like domain-containing protein [Tanacetum cinerariifolium]
VDTPIQTRHKSNMVEEQSFIATIHQKIDPALFQFCLYSCFLSQVEPKRVSDALQDPSWVEAMQEELLQFKIQKVWTLVDCPKEEGIDYDEVFAPVARIEAIRLFLAYASFMSFTVYQMVVKSAFLYGTIDEEVYVMQPPGFHDPEYPAKVYKVEKAMYGLHQAPRAWYGTLSKYLLKNGFQRGTIDQTLFIRRQREDFILVQVYVDDIIFKSTNPQLYREFEALMHEKFQMSDMGELNFFLGLQVLQKEDGIFLSQDKTGLNPQLCREFEALMHEKFQMSDMGELNFFLGLQVLQKEDVIFLSQDKCVGDILKNVGYSDQIFEYPYGQGESLRKGRYWERYEPTSSLRDVSQGKACPTDSGFIADQDRANIAKTSTFPHESTSRVTSLAADEGTQALEIIELKARVKFLEDRQGEDITHSKDDAPIKGRRFGMKGKQQLKDLVERVKLLEDREGVIRERSGDDAPIKGRRIDEEEVATKRVSSDTEEVRVDEGEVAAERASEDTEEMATVLTTMDASTVLASGAAEVPTAAVVATATVSIPTGSGVVPIASLTIPTVAPIFATATTVTPYIRRKGKEKMVDTDTPKKKKRLQEQIDVQFARELEDELEREAQRMNAQIARDGEIAKIHAEEELQKTIEGLDMTNEVIAKHLNEYEEAATELSIGERIELINELVKYQDHHSKILQYQAQQRKPQTKKQKRDYYMAVIRSYLGWKVKDFKGMTFEQVEAKFNTIWKQIEDFIPMGSKEEAVRFNRKGIRFEQEGEQEEAKKIKTSEEVPKEVKSTEEVPKEKVKEIIQLVPVEEVYVEALQVKHPIVDWKAAAERVSDDTKEMATVLTSMDAASVLSSGGVQVVPTAAVVATATVSIPTGSGVVPIASLTIPTVAPIFATATTVTPYIRRKGKEKMVDTDTPKKKKRLQEQIDVQFARELEDELEREAQRMNAQIARDGEIAKIHAEEELQKTIEGLDMTNEVIAKHLNEYEEAATELSIGERIELINELVKYQDHHSKILQYQAQQRKPQTKKQKRDYYMAVIRSYLGWKVKDFKGMTFEQVEAKFNTIWKQIEDFIPMGSKEEAVRFNRKGIRFEQEGEQEEAKKIKTSEEVPKEVKSTEEVPKEKVKEII